MLSPRFRKQFRSDIQNVPIYDGARAEPLPELQELLLLALGLCLGFFLRGFLSHSDLIMLSRKARGVSISSDSGIESQAYQPNAPEYYSLLR